MTYFENTGIKDEISTDSNIPASYLKRVGATIVDILIWILAFAPSVTLFVVGLVQSIEDADVVLTEDEVFEITTSGATTELWIVAWLLALVAIIWSLWYFGYRQGKTGLTPGKKVAGTKLIHIETGEPPGGAKGLGRSIIPSALGAFSSGIYQLIDYLWPLWDDKNQRLTDKMFSTQVVLNQGSKGAQGVSLESGTTDRSDSLSGSNQGPLGDDPIIS